MTQEQSPRLSHVGLYVSDVPKMIDFYTRVLGFRERERLRVPQTPQGPLDLVYLQLGDTTLEVMCFPEAKSRIPERAAELRQGWQCLALEVEDMDGALSALKKEGIEPSWGPMKRPDYARAEIRDPDGNPIELRHWIQPP